MEFYLLIIFTWILEYSSLETGRKLNIHKTFRRRSIFHTKTSHLICCLNQMTGFYKKCRPSFECFKYVQFMFCVQWYRNIPTRQNPFFIYFTALEKAKLRQSFQLLFLSRWFVRISRDFRDVFIKSMELLCFQKKYWPVRLWKFVSIFKDSCRNQMEELDRINHVFWNLALILQSK